jgi:hypothetical protein
VNGAVVSELFNEQGTITIAETQICLLSPQCPMFSAQPLNTVWKMMEPPEGV